LEDMGLEINSPTPAPVASPVEDQEEQKIQFKVY